MGRLIRVLQFADVINRHDFIDVIVQGADPERFEIGTCVRCEHSNIAAPVKTARAPRWVIDGTSRSRLPWTVWRLARLLREWNVDVLHSHHYEQAVIGWLETRLHRKTRDVLGRHYSDAIHRQPRAPKRPALLAVERVVNTSASRIVVPSVYILDLLVTRQGLSRHKIDVVPYGIEARKYAQPAPSETHTLREQLGVGDLVLGTFARLHEEKGHRFLLEAFAGLAARWPGLSLLLVGEGPERAAIERQIEAFGLAGPREAPGLAARCDGRDGGRRRGRAADAPRGVQPGDGGGALDAETAIMTDVSGTAEVVRDGETGLLVPRRDSRALADAIERLASDAGRRRRLGETGHAYVEANLSAGKIIPRYEHAYLQALEGLRRSG